MIKAAFFDRDDTLIKDVGYLYDLNKIVIIPGIINFCLFLQNAGYKLFVITNQSGVARGFFDEDFVKNCHKYLNELFKKQGIFFEKFFYCPHHPKSAVENRYLKDCFCRKPKPGMLLKATKEFNIDLSKSLMFGDKIIDIQAGNAAGCKSFYIQTVLTSLYDKAYFGLKSGVLSEIRHSIGDGE